MNDAGVSKIIDSRFETPTGLLHGVRARCAEFSDRWLCIRRSPVTSPTSSLVSASGVACHQPSSAYVQRTDGVRTESGRRRTDGVRTAYGRRTDGVRTAYGRRTDGVRTAYGRRTDGVRTAYWPNNGRIVRGI